MAKVYFKGKTFIASFANNNKIGHSIEYVENGFDNPKAFYEWVIERQQENGGVLTYANSI